MKAMMAKSSMLRGKVQQPLVNSVKRNFSSGGATTAGQKFGLGLGALGVAGITMLSYKGAMIRKNTPPQM